MLDQALADLKQAATPRLMSPAVKAQHLLHLGDVLLAKALAAERAAAPQGQDNMACDKASDLYFRALTLWESARATHPALCCQVGLLLLNYSSHLAGGGVTRCASVPLHLGVRPVKA